MLQAFAERLEYGEAIEALRKPFVHYVEDKPKKAISHYHGLREAWPDLKGVALFDRLKVEPDIKSVACLTWRRREIENYLCSPATLEAYVLASVRTDFGEDTLYSQSETEKRMKAMREAITEITEAMEKLGKGSPWDAGTKASNDFLTPLFRAYFQKTGLPNAMAKNSFYELARHVPANEIDPEIREKLEAIVRVAGEAKPRTGEA